MSTEIIKETLSFEMWKSEFFLRCTYLNMIEDFAEKFYFSWNDLKN